MSTTNPILQKYRKLRAEIREAVRLNPGNGNDLFGGRQDLKQRWCAIIKEITAHRLAGSS